MSANRVNPVAFWNKSSMPLLAIIILLLIATDRRPDDTSIQVALAVGAIGLFAFLDLFVNRTWHQLDIFRADWLLPGLVASFLALCTLSASWAGEPLRTLKVMAVAWALFTAWLALRFWADCQSNSRVTTLLRWICISTIALSALVFSEVASNQYIHQYLVNSLGMSMSIPNYYTSIAGHINVLMQFLSQHMGTLSYLFWPILMSIYLTFGRWKLLWMFAFAFLTAYSVFYSINETAILSLTLGALAFVAALIIPRTTVALTAIVFTVAVLAIVPLVNVSYDVLQLQLNPYIPPSGQARFAVWYNVASLVHEKFFIGHGVVHLQAIFDSGRENWIMEHAHSHNVFLQTWYELGLLGSLLILVIGSILLRHIYELPRNVVCFGIAGFVTVIASLTTTAWELWVPWHIGLVTLIAQISMLLRRIASPAPDFRSIG